MRKALLLPALFLMVVTPIALWVLSGAGTHMSPLLLYPFASPWWVLLPEGYTLAQDNARRLGNDGPLDNVYELENVRLLAGCAINAVLLGCVGLLMDRWAGRRG